MYDTILYVDAHCIHTCVCMPADYYATLSVILSLKYANDGCCTANVFTACSNMVYHEEREPKYVCKRCHIK